MSFLADRPTVTDSLGFTPYVSQTAQAVADLDRRQTPLGILVDGCPGCGKSSFLQMLERSLMQRERYRIASVSCHRFEHQDKLIVSVLFAILRQLSITIERSVLQKLQTIVGKVNELIVKSRAAKGRGADMEAELPGDTFRLDQLILDFVKTCLDGRELFILCIDDLDKVHPDAAVQFLHLLRDQFQHPQVVFIFGGEYDVIVEQLRAAADRPSCPQAFLDSFLPLRVRVPLVSTKRAAAFLTKNLPLPAYGEFLGEVVPSIRRTPRELKRYLNQIRFYHNLLDDHDHDGKIVLVLALIGHCFPEFLDDIHEHDKKLLAALGGYLKTPENQRESAEFKTKLPPFILERVHHYAQNHAFRQRIANHLPYLMGKTLDQYLTAEPPPSSKPTFEIDGEPASLSGLDFSDTSKFQVHQSDEIFDEEIADALPDAIEDVLGMDTDEPASRPILHGPRLDDDDEFGEFGDDDLDLDDLPDSIETDKAPLRPAPSQPQSEPPAQSQPQPQVPRQQHPASKQPVPSRQMEAPRESSRRQPETNERPTLAEDRPISSISSFDRAQIQKQRSVRRKKGDNNLEPANNNDRSSGVMQAPNLVASEAAQPEATDQPPTEKPKPLTREDVLNRYTNGLSLEGENLAGVDLRDTDLRGVNLRNCNLSDANFDRANLRKANLEKCLVQFTSLNSANLMDSNLIGVRGEEVDLGGANLSGANMTGAQLPASIFQGTNFRGTLLEGANLRGANLMGAEFIDANLTEAILRGAVPDQHTTFHFAIMMNAVTDGNLKNFISQKYQPNERQVLMPKARR